MKTYNIKNQDDFNRVYSKAPVRERGWLGQAFPGYYSNYQDMDVINYQQAMKAKAKQKSDEAERKINEALRKDIREETLKAIAGKENKYFKPFANQEQRDKYAAYLKGQKQSAPKTVQEKIVAYANQVGLDPNLALAVAKQESGFNPNAIGDGGKSFGLFQIHSPSHPDYKGGTNIDANIKYGVNLLKNLFTRYGGDIKKTLWAYNAGAGNVEKGILPASTKNYINNITASMGNANTSTPVATTQTSAEEITPTQINIDDFKKTLNNIYSSQNALQGGLNKSYDISDLDLNKPALMRQQMAQELNNNNPANDYYQASNQYYQNVYDLARQAGGYGLQPTQGEQPEMMNYNQMAPVPSPEQYSMLMNNELRPKAQMANQPQNIRPDVLQDYMNVMQRLQAQQAQQNQELMQQMQKAQQRDNMRNTANQILNNMAAMNNGYGDFQMPLFNGGVITVQGRRPAAVSLPTNTTSNMDAFRNQLAMKQAEQQQNQNILDMYRSVIAANEMSNVTGLPAGVFLDKDLYKTYAPVVEQQAQFKRESGMAPINLFSDLAKQSLINAGNLDVANVNARADLGKAGVAGEYQLANTQLANAMQGANQYRNAILNAQTQENINRANLTTQAMVANMNNATKLQIAQQAGANALQLAELQDALYSNNPLRQQQANATLAGAMANLMYLGDNPEQGFNLYNRIINMGNPGQATNDGGLSLDLYNQ